MNILDPIAIKEILENGVSMQIVITDIRNPQKTSQQLKENQPMGMVIQ